MDISALDSAEEGNSMNRKGRGRCGEWLWLPKRGVGARHPDGGAQQGAAIGEAEVEVRETAASGGSGISGGGYKCSEMEHGRREF